MKKWMVHHCRYFHWPNWLLVRPNWYQLQGLVLGRACPQACQNHPRQQCLAMLKMAHHPRKSGKSLRSFSVPAAMDTLKWWMGLRSARNNHGNRRNRDNHANDLDLTCISTGMYNWCLTYWVACMNSMRGTFMETHRETAMWWSCGWTVASWLAEIPMGECQSLSLW